MMMTDFMKGRINHMQKTISLLLSLLLTAALLTGCTASAEQHMGQAQGYGGPLRVTVSMNGTDITEVRVTEHSETEGVGTRAIDVLPDLIARADSVQVDNVTGATVTSEAIKTAVSQAISGVSMPESIDMTTVTDVPDPAMTGVGMAATGRLGPGTDEDGDPVYSFNVVFACADFDGQGRVTSLDVDQLEVLSSQFDGFPADEDDEPAFLRQVSAWATKGAQGEDYMLTSGSWRQQMDAYEEMMTGKTMEEINAWFQENFSSGDGKPMQTGSAAAGDAQEGGTGTDTQGSAARTSDSVTGATMSLRDEHGDILTAIQRAWEDAQRRQGTQGDMPAVTPEGGMMTDTNTEEPVTEGESSMG